MNNTKGMLERRFLWPALAVVAVYLAIRLVSWSNTPQFEGPDTLFYIKSAVAYASLDWEQISALNSDSTPVYPASTAVLILVGMPPEVAARVCSLLYSLLLLVVVFRIGALWGAPSTGLIAGLILAFSPELIGASYAAFTESSYIAIVYTGLLYVLLSQDRLSPWDGLLAGLLFGLAFVNRTEGLVYLLAVPIIVLTVELLRSWTDRRHDVPHRLRAFRYLKWWAVYSAAFVMLAAPQVAHVSSKMGDLSFNGRQAWHQLLKTDEPVSDREKLFGLDFSESEVNIAFARSNYAEVKAGLSETEFGLRERVSALFKNFALVNHDVLGRLIGPVGFVLFGAGLLFLFREGHVIPAVVSLLFVGVQIAPVLLHTDPSARHLVGIVPILAVVQAFGVAALVTSIPSVNAKRSLRVVATSAVVLVLVGSMVFPLVQVVGRTIPVNKFYDRDSIAGAVAFTESFAAKDSDQPLKMVSSLPYVPYYAGVEYKYMPFAGYEALQTYMRLNEASLILINHARDSSLPFYESLQSEAPQERFKSVYKEVTAMGTLEILQLE